MELFWSRSLLPIHPVFLARRTDMPVDLSIKRVPDDVVERLRKRAAMNHRSLQGELMAMLEEHVSQDAPLSLAQLHELVRASGFSTPSESVEMIRADRDDPRR
jgi:plasmid stability protein